MRKVIDFIRSRPTEVWLGLWAAIVAVVYGTEAPSWVAGVSAVIGWAITFIASRDSNDLGPQPGSE
jgi:hypothetical protein